MTKIEIWTYIIIAVLVALGANSISAIWASKASKFNVWLIALLIISPLVFITFGLVTKKLGLALTSGTIDSLLTVSTILVGLIFFKEWKTLSFYQYFGTFFAVLGIILIQFGHK